MDVVLNVCLALLNARLHRLDGERLLKMFPFSKIRDKHMAASWCSHGMKIQTQQKIEMSIQEKQVFVNTDRNQAK